MMFICLLEAFFVRYRFRDTRSFPNENDMVNYALGRVYKLVSTNSDRVYIGSTCQSLSKRMGGHRQHVRRGTTYQVYMHMRERGVETWHIVLLEKVSCADREELTKKEDEWMGKFDKEKLLNKNAARFTAAARTKNRAQIKAAMSVPFHCPCGSTVRNIQKQKHYRSKKHKKWATENNVPIPESERTRGKAVPVACQCGGRFTPRNKNIHAQTNIHKKWLANKPRSN